MKQCIKCFKEKDESEYYKRPDGVLYNDCKDCKRAYYRELHKLKSKSLEWRVNRSEKNKKRYHANKHMEVTNEHQNNLIIKK